MSVGDLCWVEFPARGGRAQAGRRPAIILQSATSLPTALLIPLTSQLEALRFDGTLLIEADPQNGLRQHSVALVFQLTAVDNRFIKDKLGSISENMLEQIFLVLDSLTGRIEKQRVS